MLSGRRMEQGSSARPSPELQACWAPPLSFIAGFSVSSHLFWEHPPAPSAFSSNRSAIATTRPSAVCAHHSFSVSASSRPLVKLIPAQGHYFRRSSRRTRLSLLSPPCSLSPASVRFTSCRFPSAFRSACSRMDQTAEVHLRRVLSPQPTAWWSGFLLGCLRPGWNPAWPHPHDRAHDRRRERHNSARACLLAVYSPALAIPFLLSSGQRQIHEFYLKTLENICTCRTLQRRSCAFHRRHGV